MHGETCLLVHPGHDATPSAFLLATDPAQLQRRLGVPIHVHPPCPTVVPVAAPAKGPRRPSVRE